MPPSIRVGTVPILWNNDDVPELTPPVPAEQVLAEIAAAGFEGTELGSNYPEEPQALRAALGRHGLALTGGYFCADYTDPARHADVVERARRKCALLTAAGARFLILADQLQPARVPIAGRVSRADSLSYGGQAAMADALNLLSSVALKEGLTPVFHNHAGTYVETPEELDRLLSATDPRLGLCLDTGHLTVGGGDPVLAIRRYSGRLRYVHLKDVDASALERVRQEGLGFLDALRQRVFCEVGAGSLDVAGVVSALADIGYAGWVICEQDTTRKAPLESARLSRSNLAAVLERHR